MRLFLFIALALFTACSSSPPTHPPADTTPPAATVMPSTPVVRTFERPPYLDFAALVARYTGRQAAPLTDPALYRAAPIGQRATFTLLSPSSPPTTYEVDTEVVYAGARAIWYAERGLAVDPSAVRRIGDWFENTAFADAKRRIAPNVSLPGPITIIAADLRGGVSGYVSAYDTLPTAAYPYSNERVALVISPGSTFDDERARATLVHELQHLLHQLVDPTESTWLHEGLSEWLVLANNMRSVPFAFYLRSPEVSLRDWPLDIGPSLANYAGASLFTRYMLMTLAPGGDPSALVAEQADGIDGVRNFMTAQGHADYTFEQLYLDYATANAIDAPSGKYAAPSGSAVHIKRIVRDSTSIDASSSQWAPWYLHVDSEQPFRVTFKGSETVPVLPVEPSSGDYCWWSNATDRSNSTLTRAFDLRADKPAILSFRHWHAIERLWDWGYVAVSTDGGARWAALNVTGTTTDNPIGTSVGPGFTGESDGWVSVETDLSAYAGGRVHVRFEYVTDDARHGAGWCIDDIALHGETDGAESADSPWRADGFVRLHRSGALQLHAVRVIEGTPDAPHVRDVPLDGAQAEFQLNGPATLIIIGMTEPYAQPAKFSLRLERSPPAGKT